MKTVMVILMLATAAVAQTTKPATAPANGLAYDNDAIQAKLDALNRKSKASPSTQPETERDRATLLARQQASFVGAANEFESLTRMRDDMLAARNEYDAVSAPIGELVSLRQAAIDELKALQQELNIRIQLAAGSGRERIIGDVKARDGSKIGTVEGTITNRAATEQAIATIEATYQPKIDAWNRHIAGIDEKLAPLVKRRDIAVRVCAEVVNEQRFNHRLGVMGNKIAAARGRVANFDQQVQQTATRELRPGTTQPASAPSTMPAD